MKTNLKPLTCEKARELMFDYIDGELRAGDRLRLENHIAECEACKCELSERSEMLRLIASCGENPPSELKLGVMDKIDNIPQETAAERLRGRILPMGALTAAAAAVMILVVGRGFIFGGVMNDAKPDAGVQVLMTADKYDAPEVADEAADVGNASGFTADAVKELSDADMVNNVVTAAPAENVAAPEAAEEYVYATTTALKAASPGYGLLFDTAEVYASKISATNTVDIEASDSISEMYTATYSPVDAMFEKMRNRETAILVCLADDLKLPEGDHTTETVYLGTSEFIHVTVEDGSITLFGDLLQALESDEAQYRAAVPEGDFTGLDIFMLTGAEN